MLCTEAEGRGEEIRPQHISHSLTTQMLTQKASLENSLETFLALPVTRKLVPASCCLSKLLEVLAQ